MNQKATPRNLLYVLDQYPILSQTFVSNEIDGLRKEGRNVLVVTLTEGDAPDSAIVMRRTKLRRLLLDHVKCVLRRPRRYVRYVRFLIACRGEGWRPLVAAPSLAAIAMGAHIEHIHSHFAWNASLLARATQILTELPRSMTLHANDIYVRPRNMSAKAAGAKLVNVCAYNARVVKDSFNIDTHAIVPCGVEQRDGRVALRKASDVVEILSVGRLIPKKGFNVLLHALSQLMASGVPFHCRIVGDGPEAESLRALSDELQLGACVTFEGTRNNEDVMTLYGSADVFALACQVAPDGDADAQPVVIKEAMAHGLPVVTTRLTGIPELVDESVGWIVEPGDPAALADALKSAIANDGERKLRGSRARERVVAAHSLQRQVDQLLEVMTPL